MKKMAKDKTTIVQQLVDAYLKLEYYDTRKIPIYPVNVIIKKREQVKKVGKGKIK